MLVFHTTRGHGWVEVRGALQWLGGADGCVAARSLMVWGSGDGVACTTCASLCVSKNVEVEIGGC